MHYKEFVYDTVLIKSGSSQDIRVPPNFFQITGLKKNSKKKLRVTIQVLILLISFAAVALAQEEKQTTGIGSLLTKIEATNKRITELQKEHKTSITDLETKISEKIDGLFSRLVIAVIGVHLFMLGSSKAIGGLAKYIRERKKTKALEKNNELLEEIINFLHAPQALEILKEAKKLETKTPKKTTPLLSLSNVIVAGVIVIIAIVILHKMGAV